jgi:hypothetical protein
MAVLEKLIKVQSSLKVPKTQYNAFGKYYFRNCEDILEALKPLLLEHSLAIIITDDVVNVQERYYIKSTVTLYDIEDNSSVSNTAFAREDDGKKGMDGSQVTGSTSSYARKYALNGLFGIDDNKDGDKTNDCITDKHITALYDLASKKGYNAKAVNTLIYKKYNKKPSELTKGEYDVVYDGYEGIQR